MKGDIREYIAKCQACQQNKYETQAPTRQLQPLPIPAKVQVDISMDFIGGLSRVGGKYNILVVIDILTKYTHFPLLGHPYTAKEVVGPIFKT